MTHPMNQEPEKDETFLQDCLYFTTNRLSRAITRMADEAFATTGLTPAYGYLIRLVIGSPGITQKELSEKLSITPSTLTRFVDKLETKQLVERKVHGKTVMVYPTEKGVELGPTQNYEEILGKELSDQLTQYLTSSSKQLEK
jgi:DNA-binding MarR family transcriptional regulator